jgi:calcium-dependent protein kinase
LLAIKHCHKNGIVHRDLKPENILVTNTDTIRLIDFGLSCSTHQNKGDIAGTPFYIAPEIINLKPYDTKADIWSIGVILYVLLCGYTPFQGKDIEEIFNSIRKGEVHFDYEEFESVSEEAKDLVKKMLQVDTEKRLTAA